MSPSKDLFFGVIRFVLIASFVLVFGFMMVESVFGIDVEPFANRVRTVTQLSVREWLLALMILVPGFAAGTLGLSVGLPTLAAAARLGTSDPIPANEVPRSDGAVEVEGTVDPIVLDTENATGSLEVTLSAPTTATSCVAYTWEKKERDYRPTREHPTSWVTVAENSDAVPFYVADDSGRVAVDPTDATLSLRPSIADKGVRTRDYEGRLHPGDTVHVYGYKHEAKGNDGFAADQMYVHDRLGDDPVSLGDRLAATPVFIGPPSGDGTFKISDTSKRRTMLRSAVKGLLYSLGGIGLLLGATFGVYILYVS